MPQFETNQRKIVRRLKKDGWVNSGGERHDRYVHPEKPEMVIVPRHKTVTIGVARDIAEKAGWDK